MTAHEYPGSPVFYRKLTRDYPLIARGEGCWLIGEDGKRYLDGSGGAFVANIGHGIREIGQALADQAAKIAYLNGTAFTSEPVEALAAELTSLAPGDLDKVYFLSSGSEAVEAALKLARQFWVETGKPGKHKIVALTPGYHGNTLLALSASARQHYKALYREWLVDVVLVPAVYPYRCGCTPPRTENREQLPVLSSRCAACSTAALEEAILKAGPETVAAFIAEPVGGSSTGASVPPPEYFKRVRALCDKYQILFICDEVLTGAGRTGTWSAIEHYGVVPDIMTMGKGISGGYVPLSCVIAPRRILDPIAAGSGALLHAQTFSHHAVLCAGGLAAVRYIQQHGLVERCAKMAPVFHEKLQALLEHPNVGDVRGRGLLAGVEFVADKATKAPFPRAKKFAEKFTEAALQAGLMVWPNVGQADGTSGDLAMLAPPFVISEDEMDELVQRFTTALETVTGVRGQVANLSS